MRAELLSAVLRKKHPQTDRPISRIEA